MSWDGNPQADQLKADLHDKLAGLGIVACEVEFLLDTLQWKVMYWMKDGTAHEVVVTKDAVEDHGSDDIVGMIKQDLLMHEIAPLSGSGLLAPEQSKAFLHKLINTPSLLGSMEAKKEAEMKPVVFTPGPIKKELLYGNIGVPYFDIGVDPAIGTDQTIISSASTGSGKSVITSAALMKAAKDFKESSVHIEGLGKVPAFDDDDLLSQLFGKEPNIVKDAYNVTGVTEKEPPPKLQSKAITEAPKMATSQVDTMRYQTTQRPGMMMRDMSANNCVFMGSIVSEFKNNNGSVNPETDALHFYMLNHAVAEVGRRVHPDEPLRDYSWVFKKYHDVLRTAGLRLVYYLFLICTREARHVRNSSNDSFLSHLHTVMPRSIDYVRSLPSGSSSAAQKFMNDPPNTSIGEYTTCLVRIFNEGYWSGSFGGKKWGKVAQALHDYVRGTLSIELLLDMGFALAHNGGPIFNKQVLYNHQDTNELLKILDVQRAGMIPQMICSGQSTKITTEHQDTWKGLHAILGTCMEGKVDWDWVKECGAVSKGHTVKVAATTKYGPVMKKKIFAAGKKKKVTPKGPHYTQAEGAPLGAFFVMPGLVVNKVKKERKK